MRTLMSLGSLFILAALGVQTPASSAGEGEFRLSPFRGSPAKNPTGLPYSFPKKERVKIDFDALGACLALVTREKHPVPALSRRFMNRPYDEDAFWSYLGAGSDRRFDYSTGKEQKLRAWILGQADNSVDPVILYRKSLELNDGNVWNAILAIHQLLRNEARWWDPTRYVYSSSSRDEHAFFDKFIDIRGDLVERGKGFSGDHEGSWYRLWGVVLFKLMRAQETEPKDLFRREGWCGQNLNSLLYDLSNGPANSVYKLALWYQERNKAVCYGGGDEKSCVSLEDDGPGKAAIDQGAIDLGTQFIKMLGARSVSVRMDDCLARKYLGSEKESDTGAFFLERLTD